MTKAEPFDILIVAQAGRLTYEAVLFAASLRARAPDFAGRLVVAEPRPGPLWPKDPRIADDAARDLLADLGAHIQPFEARHFGQAYPQGNKVEALASLPEDRPFVFFDTDTLILGPLDQAKIDFARPTASMAREGTWPIPPLYGPGYGEIWRALYDRFGIAFEPTCDPAHPADHWEHYLYFNAGWFTGPCPRRFAAEMIRIMTGIRDNRPPELAAQVIYPWLDQIALPLVVAQEGGGRPGPEMAGFDGGLSCHYRAMPLFFARASDGEIEALREIAAPNKIKKVLKAHEPFKRMIYQNKGDKVRALFDQRALPPAEKVIRNRIKRAKLWMR
ncbi:MAG: hypothetical protein OIF48_15510 [Silicimonas sp.]|nr:hypothetical protein [Silicimonas sp.]